MIAGFEVPAAFAGVWDEWCIWVNAHGFKSKVIGSCFVCSAGDEEAGLLHEGIAHEFVGADETVASSVCGGRVFSDTA